MSKHLSAGLCLISVLAAPCAHALPFSGLYVFGDSLSDAGNAAVALGGATTPTPVAGDTFIPSAPYTRPPPLLPAFSNGATWVEQMAGALGLGLSPSLLGGTDFAFGGARLAGGSTPPAPPTVREQVTGFISAIDTTPRPPPPPRSPRRSTPDTTRR